MNRILRQDESGVASTVAVMLSLFVALMFLELAVIAVVPQQQYTAEWITAHNALQAFDMLRSTLAGPAMPGSTFSVTIPLGTQAVSPFASSSQGALRFDDTSTAGPTVSFRFVPHFNSGSLKKVDQDVILLLDSSGSMKTNDPTPGLCGPTPCRIAGAKQYVGTLTAPDRVAIVDFDSCTRLTRLVVVSCNSATGYPSSTTGVAHHLYATGHNGDPNYAEAQTDLDLIDASGGTNYGTAIQLANNEFIAYGDRSHAWAMILLTDGLNNPTSWDAVARSEAQRAASLGIVIYTIGLGSEPDDALLQEIADITGGTYYRAATASDIRWIYFEISRRYAGAFSCGEYTGSDIAMGSVSLTLANRQYPQQTFRLESGALTVVQNSGASIHAGLPLEYVPTGPGTGSLSMTLLTFTGTAFSSAGSDYAIVQANVIARDLEDTTITKVTLDQESRAVGNISTTVQYWADQGAATQTAATQIRAPLDQASRTILWAHANATTGMITNAKFNVDSAQAELSTAVQVTEIMRTQGQIQNWLAKQTEDSIAVSGCKLDQWRNWYDGITIRITSPAAAAWANWLNETFRNVGGGVSVALSGNVALVSIHAIDRLVLDRRIVELKIST